jgi:hypothetical protein
MPPSPKARFGGKTLLGSSLITPLGLNQLVNCKHNDLLSLGRPRQKWGAA